MESIKESLVSMGFSEDLADQAIAATGGSIEQAIDWLDKRAEAGDSGAEEEKPASESSVPAELPQKDTRSVEEKLAELKERAAIKRAERSKAEAIEQRKNSELMRKSQQETREAARLLEVAQAKKLAEQRKREAAADREYRDQLRRQIELDKLEREAERRRAHATAPDQSSITTKAAPAAPAASNATPTGNVRLRVTYKSENYLKSYPAETTVEDLGESLKSELEIPNEFKLQISYPRKVITWEGNTDTLSAAGLSNSSVTIV